MASDNTKKTIYLHIGQPKTGTSSIQKYCEKNAKVLASQGLIYEILPFRYPRTGKRRNAHFLCFAPENTNDRSERIQAGLDIVKEELSRGTSVLLTDERLWNYLAPHDYDTLHTMMDFAAKNGAVLKVVVYLRPQDNWIVSLYHQHIRAGREVPSWDEYVENIPDTTQLDYKKALDDITSIVGRENLIVRVYDRSLFPGGRIENDFLDAVGIKPDDGFKDLKAEANPSLTNNYAEITRILNKLTIGQKLSDEEGRIFEYNAIYCSKNFGEMQKTNLLSPEQKKMLEEKYGPGNEAVNKTYLEKGGLNFMPQKDLPTWTAVNDARYEETVLYLGHLILEQQKQIVAQQETIDAMRSDLKASIRFGRFLKKVKRFFGK
ncbi:MAG: hypothetical protein J5842_09415 [Lachnospiraceae bacterium]|nr:hypothetical protein [Lachnospiraceae bacterium]